MKMLIVDDDSVTREYFLKLLSKYGQCDIALNGLEAIEAFVAALDEDEPYDLILLDIMMPLYDGEKVLKTLRKIEKQTKDKLKRKTSVFITSALNDDNLTARLAEQGYDAYFNKPINTDELIAKLDQLYKTLNA